ncbi:FAD-dependent oxidoreductase [Nostoc sp. FACHB-888]|uniref:FAD-dependent oxidoreductase n=1 Tax=Nostoc sp. FACHB-888 TaxID=2692842 RepID=UPI0018EF5A34|nr:FAD-dependent oxidoreductase [Nostoc sp. FACHB-888]
MPNLNRRQFLLRSTLAIAATITYDQVLGFVKFPNRFWEKDNLNGWGFFEDEELWHTTWDKPGKTGILHAYLKGKKALEMDAFEGEAQQKKLLQHWEKFLPGVNNYSVQSQFYSWTKDIWSKGGWAYPTDE